MYQRIVRPGNKKLERVSFRCSDLANMHFQGSYEIVILHECNILRENLIKYLKRCILGAYMITSIKTTLERLLFHKTTFHEESESESESDEEEEEDDDESCVFSMLSS